MPWKKSGFLIHNSLCLKAGSQMREYANNFIGLYSKSEKRFSVIRTQVASSMKGKSPFYGFFYIGHKRQRSRLTLAPLFDHDTLVIDPAARPWTMMKSFRKSLLKEKNTEIDVAEAALLNLNSNTKTTLAKVAVLACTP